MPRRNNATAEAEQVELKEWVSKSHTDSDIRLPSKLRSLLKIGGHQSYKIVVLESSNGEFVLKFSKIE